MPHFLIRNRYGPYTQAGDCRATDTIITASRERLRPILMTSLATIIGVVPMALKLGSGAEQYTPLARAIVGGLTSSVLLAILIVPAAYLLVYGRRKQETAVPQ